MLKLIKIILFAFVILNSTEAYSLSGGGDQCDHDDNKICCLCEYQNCPPTSEPGTNADFLNRCERWVNSNGCEQYVIVPMTPQITTIFPGQCFKNPPAIPPGWEGCGETKHAYFGHGHETYGEQCIVRSVKLCVDQSCHVYLSDYSPACQIFRSTEDIAARWTAIIAQIPDGVTLTVTANQGNSSQGCNAAPLTYTFTCESTEVTLPRCDTMNGDKCAFQNLTGNANPPLDAAENVVNCIAPDGQKLTMRCCPDNCRNNLEGRWIDGSNQCAQVPVCGTKCAEDGVCRPNPQDTTQPVSLLCTTHNDCGYAGCNDSGLCEWKKGAPPPSHTPCTGHSSCGRFKCDSGNCEWEKGKAEAGEIPCLIDCECPTPIPTATATATNTREPDDDPPCTDDDIRGSGTPCDDQR